MSITLKFETLEAVPISTYIKVKYDGSAKNFAKAVDVNPSQVSIWKQRDCVVIADKLYFPGRDLNPQAILDKKLAQKYARK